MPAVDSNQYSREWCAKMAHLEQQFEPDFLIGHASHAEQTAKDERIARLEQRLAVLEAQQPLTLTSGFFKSESGLLVPK